MTYIFLSSGTSRSSFSRTHLPTQPPCSARACVGLLTRWPCWNRHSVRDFLHSQAPTPSEASAANLQQSGHSPAPISAPPTRWEGFQ